MCSLISLPQLKLNRLPRDSSHCCIHSSVLCQLTSVFAFPSTNECPSPPTQIIKIVFQSHCWRFKLATCLLFSSMTPISAVWLVLTLNLCNINSLKQKTWQSQSNRRIQGFVLKSLKKNLTDRTCTWTHKEGERNKMYLILQFFWVILAKSYLQWCS